MGVDFVELIQRVETDLSVSFENEELGQLRTVGDLYRLVLAKKDVDFAAGKSCCLTAVAFFRTRSLLASELNLTRREIRPSAKLEAHLPIIARRGVWNRIQARSKMRIPDLQRHTGLATTLLLFCIAVALIPVTDSAFSLATLWDAAWLAVWGSLAWWAILRMTPVATVALPKGVVTFGDLAKSVCGLNYGALVEEYGQAQQSEIWSRLAFLIVDQLGVTAGQVVPEASFLDDLRVD